MIKVLNPLMGHGKMLISYNGHNELLKSKPAEMKEIYMYRNKEIKQDLYEDMVIETKLFDGTEICFSLVSANLYYKELVADGEIWINSYDNFADFSEIKIDNQQIIFQGHIVMDKKITYDFVSHEEYKVILFYSNTKDLIQLLDQFDKEYNYHT
jgi:hypothetical protein